MSAPDAVLNLLRPRVQSMTAIGVAVVMTVVVVAVMAGAGATTVKAMVTQLRSL